MATKESETDVADTTTSTKRKSTVQEIQVDLSAPEPPSKRARRALKKGKVLPKNPDSDDDKEGSDGDGKDRVRPEHAIWVGNLPYMVTAAELQKWLIDNSGHVITDASITRVKLPTAKVPGRDKSRRPINRGFAYVGFTDVGGKLAAIALSETQLGGRKLLIKDAESFEGRPAKAKHPADAGGTADGKLEADVCRKVFVGNMSFKTTEAHLTGHFSKCGDIEWVKVATFEDTGNCKGYGWIKFKEPEAASWAVKGFVKIKEEMEAEEDFKDDAEDADGDKHLKQKRFKTRKWWVNRLLGRELKLELAEDDQMRYKKRFGKGAPNRGGSSKTPRDGDPKPHESRDAEVTARDAEVTAKPVKEACHVPLAITVRGEVVKHMGTKVKFD